MDQSIIIINHRVHSKSQISPIAAHNHFFPDFFIPPVTNGPF